MGETLSISGALNSQVFRFLRGIHGKKNGPDVGRRGSRPDGLGLCEIPADPIGRAGWQFVSTAS